MINVHEEIVFNPPRIYQNTSRNSIVRIRIVRILYEVRMILYRCANETKVYQVLRVM